MSLLPLHSEQLLPPPQPKLSGWWGPEAPGSPRQGRVCSHLLPCPCWLLPSLCPNAEGLTRCSLRNQWPLHRNSGLLHEFIEDWSLCRDRNTELSIVLCQQPARVTTLRHRLGSIADLEQRTEVEMQQTINKCSVTCLDTSLLLMSVSTLTSTSPSGLACVE